MSLTLLGLVISFRFRVNLWAGILQGRRGVPPSSIAPFPARHSRRHTVPVPSLIVIALRIRGEGSVCRVRGTSDTLRNPRIAGTDFASSQRDCSTPGLSSSFLIRFANTPAGNGERVAGSSVLSLIPSSPEATGNLSTAMFHVELRSLPWRCSPCYVSLRASLQVHTSARV